MRFSPGASKVSSEATERPTRRLSLLVEPDPDRRRFLAAVLGAVTAVDAHAQFETARAVLAAVPYHLLVTNIRLAAFNGIHLVYLARRADVRHSVVYSDHSDLALARDAQNAGAFFEAGVRLPAVLPKYALCELPGSDRRNTAAACRRAMFRGGRRCTDRLVTSAKGFPQLQA